MAGPYNVQSGVSSLERAIYQPLNYDNIAYVILDNELVKYVLVKVFRDIGSADSKYILRGYRNPTWDPDEFISLSHIPNGVDHQLFSRVRAEMDSAGVRIRVIGWGKLIHSKDVKTVTFYEEERHGLLDKYSGHSEQCFRARVLIDTGKYEAGYVSYHAFSDGALSPDSFQRRLTKR